MKKSIIISAVVVLGLVIGGVHFASAQMGWHMGYGNDHGMRYDQGNGTIFMDNVKSTLGIDYPKHRGMGSHS